MSEDISIEIGDSFATKHEQFKKELDDEYEMRIRSLVENEIHSITQQLERQQDQMSANITE